MMKISEVSEKYALSADTLRYYERVGLLPPVNRTDSGIRDYNDLDLRRVEFVKCMRNAGLPVDVLVEYVRLVQQGDQTAEARREILIAQRERLLVKIEELQKVLGILDHKIEVYDHILLNLEQKFTEAVSDAGS
jgi:DNA-binding transcriptional MerR regulator